MSITVTGTTKGYFVTRTKVTATIFTAGNTNHEEERFVYKTKLILSHCVFTLLRIFHHKISVNRNVTNPQDLVHLNLKGTPKF